MRAIGAHIGASGAAGVRAETRMSAMAKAVSRARPAAPLRGAPAPAARRAGRLQAAPARAAAAAAAAPDIVTREEVLPDSSSVRLTVTVPADMCKKAYRTVMTTWNNKIAVTGYRKGKAPEAVLIDQLGGVQRVYNTVIAELMEDVLAGALETTPSAARAIADSERVEQSGAELEASFSLDADFTFSVLFDTLPALAWTTPYKDLAVTVEAVSSPERDAAAAAAKLRALRKEGGQMRVVADRGLTRGDVTIIDFSAAVAETGETIPGASRQGMQLDTETADEAFLPGVAAALEGMRPGESKETVITMPDSDDFSPAALRGVACAVSIKVSEVFEWDLPAADDAWAAQVMGPGSTLADVTARLAENTAAESEDATRQRLADAFTDAVAAAVEVTIPDSLIQEAGQNQYTNELNGLMTQGILSYEQAEQLASPQMLAQYISNKKEELVALQKAALGFADILEREGLAPSEADVERELAAALESIAEVQGRGRDVNVDAVKEQVAKGLETQAAMDWLVANCNVTVLPHGSGGGAGAAKKAAKKTTKAKAEGEAKPKRAPAKPKADKAAEAAPADAEAPKKRRGRPPKAKADA